MKSYITTYTIENCKKSYHIQSFIQSVIKMTVSMKANSRGYPMNLLHLNYSLFSFVLPSLFLCIFLAIAMWHVNLFVKEKNKAGKNVSREKR